MSKYLKKGDWKTAQVLARVDTPSFGNEVADVESYSGYITVDTVDPNCHSNLFFWYFAAEVSDIAIILHLFTGSTSTILNFLFSHHMVNICNFLYVFSDLFSNLY